MTYSLRWAWLAALLVSWQAAAGQDKKGEPTEGDAPAAILKSPIGTLLIGGDKTKGVQLPALYDYVPVDKTLLALPGGSAVLDMPKAGAQLKLWGNLPQLSPSPVLESVVRLRADKGADVALSLLRGRIMLTNQRKDGAVKATIHLGKEQLDLTLATPSAAVVIERFHPWIAGVPFATKPETPRKTDVHVALLVTKGKVEVKLQGELHNVAEAAAFLRIGAGRLQGPSAVAKLPDWLWPNADLSDTTTAWHKGVESFRRLLALKKDFTAALASGMEAKDAHARAAAVLAAAAAGDMLATLSGWRDKAPEVRQSVTRALRQRIGSGSDADLKLYGNLLEAKIPVGQSQIVMELLHGFGGHAVNRPETYEALINYLQHQQPAIRELAAANLYALVPHGKNIAYDASASPEDRGRAQAAWRKLIPEGKTPPRDGDS